MDTGKLLDRTQPNKAWFVFILCISILVGAVLLAWCTQRDFGRVEVSNVTYENFNGIMVRAKLLRPVGASQSAPAPGAVYIHGYQNNRETADAYCIELARRGFVVLNIDAIGRGNSGIPNDPNDPDFDPTYGGRSSLAYLRSLPYVDAKRTGMMGHSLGAEMAYAIALEDPALRALVISGFAYTSQASPTNPKNMLMIFGKWDEYRKRMTGVDDVEEEWMSSPQTQAAIGDVNPQIGVTYGSFAEGTARRVFVPHVIHIQESHSRIAIVETLEWMRAALKPDERYWVEAQNQIWPIKEWSTLVAMVAGFASLLPLGLMLLRLKFFSSLGGMVSGEYACPKKETIKYAAINGLLMWLYLPLIFLLFGVHVYLVRIDKAFPMMMVNGIVWWFLIINLIGFLLFRRWFKRQARERGLTLAELGISFREERFGLDWLQIGKTALLAAILFVFAYFGQHLLEKIFIVDYRFIFPFASDLTPYRVGMFFLYLPFLLIGFIFLGFFLHGQLRRPKKGSWMKTFASWSLANVLVLVVPILVFLMIQYIPLLTAGVIPFVGPGGVFVTFIINLFHIIVVLLLAIPISTWFYQLTGKVYLGAFLNALLVAWMFTSSQVIAPIPI